MTNVPVRIPFNRAYVTGAEFGYMQAAIENAHLAGNGPFSLHCREWLQQTIGARRALLTHSCTGALEMALTLAEIGMGDEVIMPSFTFVSTANAVVVRGGTPVFVDVRPDTYCINESLVETAITKRTKAIVPVHYAGVGCEMDVINDLAARNDLVVIEDAAHGIEAFLDGQPLGGLGQMGTLSFHETKNVSCGEGGALLVNDDRFVDRAEIIHEKGTDRQRFFKGQVDKYTWVDVGSSYALSDLAAAYLWAQLQHVTEITAMRLAIWNSYHEAFEELEAHGYVRRPIIPLRRVHNAHLYSLVVDSFETRTALIRELDRQGINAVFHYVPLHTSAAGRRYCRIAGDLSVTDFVGDRLVRLPLWSGMSNAEIERVIEGVRMFFAQQHASTQPTPRTETSSLRATVVPRPESRPTA
jgi:dTDP-4-amino-4,6-dideoxygalactose transaminase